MAVTTDRRRLIINADDFGLAPGVNVGIVEAHRAGTVSSTSMMVHCPGWHDALTTRRTAPTLGIGLHFNVLLGAPITAAQTLIDRHSGLFLPLGTLVQRALLRAVSGAEIEAECEAQLAALRAEGITVTHIDSHRHTHALPVFRGAVARVAARHGLPLRRPTESLVPFAMDVSSVVHRALVATAYRVTSAGAAATRGSDHFTGIALQGAGDFASRVLRTLDTLRPGTTELMVHPGHVDAALTRVDGYTAARERELVALTSPAVRDRLLAGDITRIGFAEL